ncbi:hypothetical protein [Dyadobacter chenhuakuii]|uniref:Uncharacterized protein n=1 Tax=Dyadobacter chenhuakuii TaxID=2909339 RepID=A0ABY4XLV7_9BACT|nr:hypothetical protein [Dyadobacter chenhuakuii]MCF2494307.1 hypothetical protein [Dyadobacter chenhuakuii]USJ31431.1 hypothetical protein NFI80_01555 [Dyadobacter chenhuakuii]
MSGSNNDNKRLTSADYESSEKKADGKQPDLHFPAEFDMILAYREKMKLISEQLKQSDINTHPTNEPLGLILDHEKIQKVMDQKGFHSLVAFFAVEESSNPLSKNTLVIMGVDHEANLLPYDLDHGLFTQAQETWSTSIDKVEDEVRFQEFFRVNRKYHND